MRRPSRRRRLGAGERSAPPHLALERRPDRDGLDRGQVHGRRPARRGGGSRFRDAGLDGGHAAIRDVPRRGTPGHGRAGRPPRSRRRVRLSPGRHAAGLPRLRRRPGDRHDAVDEARGPRLRRSGRDGARLRRHRRPGAARRSLAHRLDDGRRAAARRPLAGDVRRIPRPHGSLQQPRRGASRAGVSDGDDERWQSSLPATVLGDPAEPVHRQGGALRCVAARLGGARSAW